MAVSEERRHIEAYLRGVLKKPCSVEQYSDHENVAEIPILHADATPADPLQTHATVTLSDPGPVVNGVGVELVFVSWSDDRIAGRVLATCALNAKKSGRPPTLHAKHRGILAMSYPGYYPSAEEVAHIVLVSPRPTLGLERLRLANKTVTWLQLVLVSDAELAFAEAHGVDQLMEKLKDLGTRVFDRSRRSVL